MREVAILKPDHKPTKLDMWLAFGMICLCLCGLVLLAIFTIVMIIMELIK